MTSKNINKLNISLSFAGHAVADFYESFAIGLIPLIAHKFKLSSYEVSLIAFLSIVPYSVQFIFGYLTDRFGLKYLMVSSILFSSIIISLLGIWQQFYVLLLIVFLANIGTSALHAPCVALVGYIDDRKNKSLINSVFYLGGALGASIGPLLLIFIVESLGSKFIAITTIPGIILSIIFARLIKEPKRLYKSREKNTHDSISIKNNFFLFFKSINKIKIIFFLIISFAVYTCFLIIRILMTFLPLYYTQTSVSVIDVGKILLIFGLIGGIGGLVFGYLADKTKQIYILQLILFLSVILMFFIFKAHVLISVILFVLLGFIITPITPICLSISQRIFPNNISFVSSLIIGLNAGLSGLTLILVGKISDSIGIIKTINYVLILPVIALMLLIFIKVFKRDL